MPTVVGSIESVVRPVAGNIDLVGANGVVYLAYLDILRSYI
jgi:hypothetical protein